LLYQLLKKRDFYFINFAKIGKKGPKMEFFDFFEISIFLKSNRSNVFHDLKNVKIAEKSLKIGQFLPILAHFSHIL
jgi:hypothetical protein